MSDSPLRASVSLAIDATASAGHFDLDPFSLLSLGAALLGLFLMAVVLRRKKRRLVHQMFIFLNLSVSIWALLQFFRMNMSFWFEPAAPWYEFLAWTSHLVMFTGIASISTHWLILAAAFTRRLEWTRGWRRAALYAPFVWGVSFAITNPLHHLFFAHYEPGSWTYGPAFWPSTVVSYLFILWSIKWYVTMARDVKEKVFRRQVLVMVLGSLPPLVGNQLWVTRHLTGISFPFDFTPLLFAVTVAIFAYALLKMGWLNILPLAIRELFDTMSDAVIVLDFDRVVMQGNPAARRLFPRIESGILIDKCAPEVGEGLNRRGDAAEASDEFEIRVGEAFYWGRIIDLGRGDKGAGSLVILTDITERKKTLEAVRKTEERYRAFVEHSSEGIWRIETEWPMSVELPVDEQVRCFYEYGYLAECNKTMAEMYGYSSPDEFVGARLNRLLDPADPKNIGYLRAFVESGYRLLDGESHEYDTHGNAKYFLNNMVGVVEDGLLVRAWGSQRDITERKKAENALRASESRYRQLFERNLAGVYRCGLDGRVLDCNEAAAQIIGYDSREDTLSHKMWDFYYDTADRERIIKLLREKRTPTNFEGRGRRKDGSEVWVLANVSLLDGEDGQAPIIEGTLVDITARKQAEEALQDSERRYRLLFESNPHAMWVYDLQTLAFLAVNDAAVVRYGYSHEEFLAMTIKDIRPPEDIGALLEMQSSLSPTVMDYGTWRHRTKGGVIIDVEIASHGLEFAGRKARLVLANDVTQRQRTQEALQKSEERFRSLIEDGSDIILILSPSGEMRYVSPSALRVLGYEAEDVVGANAMAFVHPDDLAVVNEALRRTFYGQNRNIAIEFRVRRKDGAWRILESMSRPLADLDGPSVVVNCRDITERKLAEEDLHRAKEAAEAGSRHRSGGLVDDGVLRGAAVPQRKIETDELGGDASHLRRQHAQAFFQEFLPGLVAFEHNHAMSGHGLLSVSE